MLYRIYVDLLDAENGLKILKIILAEENLQSGFQFEHLSNETEGYSGSDLKAIYCFLLVVCLSLSSISYGHVFCRTSVSPQHIDLSKNFWR